MGPPAFDEESQPLRVDTFEFDDGHTPTISKPRLLPHERWLPSARRLFSRVRNISGAVITWLKGPESPQIQVITPLLPSVQAYPVRWLNKTIPRRQHQLILLAIFCLCWMLAFGIPLHLSAAGGRVDGAAGPIQYLDCADSFWLRGNGCGVDGNECRPFNGSSFAFRCPGNCARVQVLNPYHVGPEDIVYRPLVIGGPVYRGDSFICGSAIHAGYVSDLDGGCGIVSLIGEHDDFPGTPQNGIASVAFDSSFPLSFTFATDSRVKCGVKDLRWVLLIVSSIFTGLLSVFTTSPSLQFFTIFTALFAHVSLVSDPSGISNRSTSVLPELFSNFVGRLLPATFSAAVIFRFCVQRSLQGLTAQFEKTALWLGGCWIGALSNYTFDWVPISRLTAHDLEQQPGAKLALAMIMVVLTAIIGQQVYYFRLEGRLPRYLALYGTFLMAIIISLALPGLQLRIHHYVLALLLLPGTSMQTRPSLLYQGLLIGLFINGTARWGFDSILQTPDALREDSAFNSPVPSILEPVISLGAVTSNITLRWAPPPLSSLIDGISVLVNDVERYRAFFRESPSADDHFTWTRRSHETPEYFRFAYVKDSKSLDYTEAGTWSTNGSWSGLEQE